MQNKVAKLSFSDNLFSLSPQQTKQDIADSKPSRALGPDGLCNAHVKNLGPLALDYMTHLFNLSLSENIIPQMWKNSKIILLPKPEKDHKNSTSYMPISLLRPAVKMPRSSTPFNKAPSKSHTQTRFPFSLHHNRTLHI